MPTVSPIAPDTAPLTERWSTFRGANPKAYIRDAAAALGVSELELLLLSDGDVSRLRSDDWGTLIAQLGAFGAVKTMTRNEDAVIERTGTYANYQSFGMMAQTLGEIDLRIFLREWKHVVAVSARTDVGVRLSLQVFDASGDSIHKVFVPAEQRAAFDALVQSYAGDDAPLELMARPTITERDDAEIDAAGFLARWDSMTDTHQFHGLLREFGVSRTQALRLAGPTRALRVSPGALQQLLEGAAASGERLMVFVGNRGIVQIHIGAIHKVVHMAGWLNVLDPGFNLHARDTAFAASWVVTKQSADGPIRSLEVYDEAGNTIVQVFGKRSEGEGSTPVGFGALLDQVLASCVA